MSIREKVILEGEDQASKAFEGAGGSFEKMGGTLKKVALAGGIAIAGRKLIDLGTTAVGMAIDAEEAAAAFDTTFGQALPQMSGFVDEFANKAGFATHEMEQMLAVVGNVAQGIGATETESAELAQEMAILAGDVASFSNAAGGAPAVLQALQSAMNGEREALKTYGLAVSEAEVQERALQDTQKQSAEELTRLEKAQATMAIAYEKAGKAVGDLDRTSDSSANTLRRLAARVKEAAVEAGDKFLPALEDILPKVEEAIPAVADLAVNVAELIANIAASAPIEKATDLLDGLSVVANSFNAVGAGIGSLFTLGEDDLDRTREFSEHANDIIGITRELEAAQVPGGNTATQYANALAEVQRMSFISAEAIDQLATASGASDEEQLRALETLRAYGRENGYTREEIFALSTEINSLRGSVNETTGEIAASDQAMLNLGGSVNETTGEIEAVGEPSREAADEILKMAEAAGEAAKAFRDDLADEANEFITGFEELPERVDTTMDEFEENLTDRVEAQTAFWEGLATLAQSGFGHLAEEIRTQGPEAAGLLEELTGDMERAAELDEMIRGAGEQMGDVTDAYATSLEENGDAVLTPLGQFGLSMTEAIADGIRSGDLSGPLMAEVNAAVAAVTGHIPTPSPGAPPPRPTRTNPGGGNQYQEGTWGVPGAPGDRVNAVLHGTEIVVPPEGSGGRAQFARELAAELSRVLGGSGGGQGTSVTIEKINVTVPAGTTIGEAITAGGAQGAIEALLN